MKKIKYILCACLMMASMGMEAKTMKDMCLAIIGYVIFHCVVREESLELAVELCRQRLVMAQYERRLVNVGYDVGNGECLSGAGHAQQGLCGNSLKHSFGELCDCFRLVAGGAVGGC